MEAARVHSGSASKDFGNLLMKLRLVAYTRMCTGCSYNYIYTHAYGYMY